MHTQTKTHEVDQRMYKYDLKITGETKGGPYGDGFISKDFVIQESGSIENMIATFKEGFIAECPHVVEEQFAEKGYAVNFLELKTLHVNAIEQTRQHGWVFIKLQCRFIVTIETEQCLTASPILVEIVWVLTKLLPYIVTLVLGLFFIHEFFDWLKSVTTTSWEVTEYGWVENPQTGELEWKQTKTEKGTEPSLGGISLVGIFFLLFIVLLLFWFVGGPTRRRKK